MRLVKTPTKKLSEEHTARLMDMVKQSAAKDQKFFEICEYNRKLLRGAHWQKGKPSMNEVVINLAHTHARTMLPTLFFQDPYAEMEPVSPGHEESAVVWGSLLNHVWERIGYKGVRNDDAGHVLGNRSLRHACFTMRHFPGRGGLGIQASIKNALAILTSSAKHLTLLDKIPGNKRL